MTQKLLKAVPAEDEAPPDFKTIDQIIGRDASERIIRHVPKFKDVSDKRVSFGRMLEILKQLSK